VLGSSSHGRWQRDLNLVQVRSSMRCSCNVVVWGALPKNYEHSRARVRSPGSAGHLRGKSHFVTIFFPVGAILFLRRVSVQFCDTTDVKAFPSPHPTYPKEFSM
jgi:hypothetical protein